eukprot:3752486-Karenia_brevis.AAC.1
MQVPIAGSADFIQEWVSSKMGIIRRIMEGLRGLSSKQVALYLLRGAGDGCRAVYYVRCCPRELLGSFLNEFDGEVRRTLEEVVGSSLSESQWDQAAL